jgi:hypothetical protein
MFTLDPIPTFLLKESIDALLLFITAMINASRHERYLPVMQEHALVSPLLKKTSLDPNELKNYRPVSNSTFVSKVVERIVVKQLVEFLQSNSPMPRLQSAKEAAVDSERCRQIGHRYAEILSHYTGASRPTQASDSESHYLKGSHACLQMPSWSSAIVSGGFLPTRFICFWSATSTLG